ncbi:MAG: hypothetical protein Kow00105_20230 [Phycisphaeraceae bacterium]
MLENRIWQAAGAFAVGLVFAAGVWAQNDPIAQIDVNWNGSATYQAGGFPAWGAFEPTAITVPGGSHSQTFGAVGLTLTPAFGPDVDPSATTTLDGRDRFLDFGEGAELFLQDVYTDFVFFPRNTSVGLGHNFYTYSLTGLAPDSVVRVRIYNYEPNASPTDDLNFMAYSTVSPGAVSNYQPVLGAGVEGQYENLTPMLARSRYTGPWPADPVVNDPLAYSTVFTVPTDSLGTATFYGWADTLSYSTDTAGRFNGMEVWTQLRGDMNFDDVVDANDAPMFNDIIAGNRPQLLGLDDVRITSFAAGVDQGAHAWDAAADMNGDGVLDATDTALFNALIGGLDGDLDGDGFVGIADLNIVLGNWNQSVTAGDPLVGDPSGDGFVGIEDLNSVLGNWNAGTPPTGGAAVPEPATFALLGLGGLVVLRRRV